jgi:hypothetical protein
MAIDGALRRKIQKSSPAERNSVTSGPWRAIRCFATIRRLIYVCRARCARVGPIMLTRCAGSASRPLRSAGITAFISAGSKRRSASLNRSLATNDPSKGNCRCRSNVANLNHEHLTEYSRKKKSQHTRRLRVSPDGRWHRREKQR